jgi:transcriptional regulator with XRE-family HTH domain
MMRRRQLMTELKRLRENARLTQDDVAEQLDWHATKLMRIETGRTAPHPNDVRLMLDVYGVTDQEQVHTLAKLARDARQRGWWYSYRDILLSRYDFFIGLESEASSIRSFELAMIPGLLQTASYARAVICAGQQKLGRDEVDRLIEVRSTRQRILAERDEARLWAILDESVIHRVIGGSSVMREQLEHLIAVGEQGRVAVQVVPYGTDAHPGLAGPFTILGFDRAAEPDIVYLESVGGNLCVDKPEETRLFADTFDHLRTVAHSPGETQAMLRAVADELK